MSRASGTEWEGIARQHLEDRGLRHVESNYHCRRGELDLIMQDEDDLVFVEVRYRRDPGYGTGAESVDRKKRARLIATASHWLSTHPGLDDNPCRFDVVSMSGTPSHPKVDWIRDAFSAN